MLFFLLLFILVFIFVFVFVFILVVAAEFGLAVFGTASLHIRTAASFFDGRWAKVGGRAGVAFHVGARMRLLAKIGTAFSGGATTRVALVSRSSTLAFRTFLAGDPFAVFRQERILILRHGASAESQDDQKRDAPHNAMTADDHR